MSSSVLVELQATTSEFMAKMGEARGEVAKLNTEGSANMAKFQTVAKAAFLGVVAAGVAVGAMATDLAVKYDASVAQIQGSAQLTEQAAKGIGDAFLHTAGDSTFSAQEMATSFAPVAGVIQTVAGHALTAADAMKVMHAATDLAEASNQPLATTTSDLSKVMQAYGLNVDQASEASNTLYNISRLTGVPLDSLTDTVDKLHGRLGIAAPDLAQTGALMEDLAQHGISGSRGVMVANTALTTLLGGTKPVTAELKTLGVNIFESSGKFIGMQGAIAQLSPKLAEMTDKQRLAAEAILFGSTSGVAMNATLLAGADAYSKATAAVTQHDAVEKAAEASSSTLEGQYKTLKATVEDYATMLGERLIPIITSTVGWMNQHKGMALVLAAVVGGALVAAAAAYVAGLVYAAAASTVNFVKMIVLGDSFAASQEASFGKALATAIRWVATTTAQFAVWTARQAASIAESSALWVMYAAQWLATTATATATWLAEQTVAAATWTAEQATMLAEQTARFIAWGAETVATATATAAVWIAENVAMAAAATAAFIAENAASLGIVAALAAVVAGIIYVATHWSQVWGDIKAVASDAADWIKSHLLYISAAFGPVTLAAYELAHNWSAIWGGIGGAVGDAWSFISGIFNDIKRGLDDITSGIGKVTSLASKVPGGSTALKWLGKLAGGGPASANTPYLIGEEGPEIFVPDTSGVVLPNSALDASAGRGSPLSTIEPKVDNSDVIAKLDELLDAIKSMPREQQRLLRTG